MKKVLIITLILAFFACSNNKKTPEYVIPFDDMVSIIVDIHITDGLLTSNKIRRDLVRNDTINFYSTILSNYNYTRSDFDTSLYYYSKNINEYDLIYDEVLDRLSEMESKIKENRDPRIDKE